MKRKKKTSKEEKKKKARAFLEFFFLGFKNLLL